MYIPGVYLQKHCSKVARSFTTSNNYLAGVNPYFMLRNMVNSGRLVPILGLKQYVKCWLNVANMGLPSTYGIIACSDGIR